MTIVFYYGFLQDQLEDLQRLCLQEGIEDWKLHQTLCEFSST